MSSVTRSAVCRLVCSDTCIMLPVSALVCDPARALNLMQKEPAKRSNLSKGSVGPPSSLASSPDLEEHGHLDGLGFPRFSGTKHASRWRLA